jgi:hypothetical protein
MYLVNIESKKNNLIHIADYITLINIYTILPSFIINDYKILLLIRYLSWIYTFPFIILHDNYINKQQLYKSKIFIFILLLFIINIITFFYYNFLFNLSKYVIGVILIYYLNNNDNNHFYNFKYFFNSIIVFYSFFQILYEIKILNDKEVYYCFSLSDLFSKFIFIFYKYLKYNTNFSYGILKVIKIIQPTIYSAYLNNIITFNEYELFLKIFNISDDNMEDIKKEYFNEIFPKSINLENLFEIKKQYILMKNTKILFCDMVNYTEFIKNNNFEVTIPYINNYFCKIDSIVEKYKITKVEIIGDAYLMISDNIDHILNCGFELIYLFNDNIRIGIHVGDITSCNIGFVKLRTSYIGHPLNFTARLENTSLPGKIHISEDIVNLLNNNNKYIFIKRDNINLKGIGIFNTYFIEKKINE